MKKKIGKYIKRQWVLIVSITATVAIFGCQKTPETEYVTNKEGLGNLIQDNVAMDNGISVRQQVQAPVERVNQEVEGTNPYTTIKLEAEVVVPETTAIPVYRLGYLDVDSELAERYVQAVFDDGKVQSIVDDGYTEEECLEEIERLAKEIKDGQTSDGYRLSEEDMELWQMDIENYQNIIAEGMTRESAGYGGILDYTFRTDEYTLSNDCQYKKEYCSFTGERNGIESCLYFERDGINQGIFFCRKPDILTPEYRYVFSEKTKVTTENTCQFSAEEAEELCSDFLSQLDLDDMVCGQIRDIEVSVPNRYVVPYEEVVTERNGYSLHFYRSYDSALDLEGIREQEDFIFSLSANASSNIISSFASHAATEASGTSEENFQIPNMQETAMFIVNDDGIISAVILNPMVTEECLAENVKLLSFDRVLEQGMAQLKVQYGDSGTSSNSETYRIKTIELSYARMQSPDSEGEYTLIPVWNFKMGTNGKILVSINAIDGTVFNPDKGY